MRDHPPGGRLYQVRDSRARKNGLLIRSFRLYTQLDISSTGEIAKDRQAKSAAFQESGGRVETNTITAEEVLKQANKIFHPYTLKFAAPLSWFAVWKSTLTSVRKWVHLLINT